MTISGVTMQQYLGSIKDSAEIIILAFNNLNFNSFTNETTKEYMKVRINTALLAENFTDDFAVKTQEQMVEAIAKSSKQISEDDLSLNKEEYNSFSFIAESLLQLARHGLSIVHGSFNDCRSNITGIRSIVNHPNPQHDIFDIIWAARNQAIHFDEIAQTPNRNKPAEVHMHRVFNWLASLQKADFAEDIRFNPSIFSKFNTGQHNLAYQVIQTLGWTNYEQFKTDMESLG
ncbi:hypothetical protein ABIC59_004585 [Priestia aryabhattai]|uniref:hypothetical protein n=1 Tax=Priestia aryabhattai TaxID=412384 RepID=UPI0033925EC0